MPGRGKVSAQVTLIETRDDFEKQVMASSYERLIGKWFYNLHGSVCHGLF